jgi:hypothetical protein
VVDVSLQALGVTGELVKKDKRYKRTNDNGTERIRVEDAESGTCIMHCSTC